MQKWINLFKKYWNDNPLSVDYDYHLFYYGGGALPSPIKTIDEKVRELTR
jgi:hypothetical protein